MSEPVHPRAAWRGRYVIGIDFGKGDKAWTHFLVPLDKRGNVIGHLAVAVSSDELYIIGRSIRESEHKRSTPAPATSPSKTG